VRAHASRAERVGFWIVARAFGSARAFATAQRLGRLAQRPFVRRGWFRRFPPGPLRAWGRSRDLPALPAQTFREWLESRERA
jgi:L-lactate dehydrogenase complex protein LldF